MLRCPQESSKNQQASTEPCCLTTPCWLGLASNTGVGFLCFFKNDMLGLFFNICFWETVLKLVLQWWINVYNLGCLKQWIAVTLPGFKSRFTLEKGLLEIRADPHLSLYPVCRNVLKKYGMEIKKVIAKTCNSSLGQRGAWRIESIWKKG